LNRIADIYQEYAAQAGRKGLSHLQFLQQIIDEEATAKFQRSVRDKIKRARIPVLKTLDAFDWAFPKRIPKQRILDLFDLDFISKKTNVIFLGPTGVGKSHLAQAMAYQACLAGITTVFSTAIGMINYLNAALSDKTFLKALRRFTSPELLVCDELGYLPVDKQGADLLFQVISARYERGSILLTSNRAFKDWGKTFNNDNTIASAVIDRLAHHSEVILIEGDSYRMKGKIPDK
jgi:DNA replication protein DnaC